jgi:hypothetical protein
VFFDIGVGVGVGGVWCLGLGLMVGLLIIFQYILRSIPWLEDAHHPALSAPLANF